MFDFSKRHINIYHRISISVVVVYAFMTSAIDLFHNDGCLFGTAKTNTSDIVSSNEPCIACKFLDSSNSTEVDFNPYLIVITGRVISQSLPRSAVVNPDEFSYSITSRAPPLITIS
jgi:hypothetical protein